MTQVYSCTGFGAPTVSKLKTIGEAGERLRIVDAHCHVLSPSAEEVVRDRPEKRTNRPCRSTCWARRR